MKVVHKRGEDITGLREARDREAGEEMNKSIAFYEGLLKKNPVHEEAYRRLMILYRKQKNYRKELAVIRAGIRAFEELYQPSRALTGNKKITALSRALLKSTGLADKKGNPLYQKEPLGSWTRRKTIVEKKIKSQTKK